MHTGNDIEAVVVLVYIVAGTLPSLTDIVLIMRPSSVGGGRILRRTLSVCPSVRPSRSRK